MKKYVIIAIAALLLVSLFLSTALAAENKNNLAPYPQFDEDFFQQMWQFCSGMMGYGMMGGYYQNQNYSGYVPYGGMMW
ncbi:hypothetical protein [Calderihabitans maritimus]|uniref:Uncharacterized protein n=1 Tax=Calderihabitans maritimus TaxID=1246530 RepID=A0A1Z5HRL1_9FIRM|nr:hypothetical protein [Calderihabitans maritimus]GAW91955.1 hypothetical protein KKC1_11150 [Calderihabitans maritimus]